MTPQQAAEKAIKEQSPHLFEGESLSLPVIIRAIELYEACRDKQYTVKWYKQREPKRVMLTPEQAKAFEERVDEVDVYLKGPHKICTALAFFERNMRGGGGVKVIAPDVPIYASELRQLAAVCEAMAENLRRFSS